MNLELPKPPIGLAQDEDTWVYLPSKSDLNEVAQHWGPQRTSTALLHESNYSNTGYSDVAADIMGVAFEAYAMDYVGYDPLDPAHIWVYPFAPPVEQADFGPYECKRTNKAWGMPKYRAEGNADHIILQGMVDAAVDGDNVDIHGVYLMGWYQPRTDHAYSKHMGYDSKGRELRSIKPCRRRTMDTLPILVGEAA